MYKIHSVFNQCITVFTILNITSHVPPHSVHLKITFHAKYDSDMFDMEVVKVVRVCPA